MINLFYKKIINTNYYLRNICIYIYIRIKEILNQILNLIMSEYFCK